MPRWYSKRFEHFSKRIALIGSCSALVCALIFVLGAASLFYDLGPHTDMRRIILPKGASLQQVARILARDHLVRNPTLFVLAGRLLRYETRLHAGEYAIPAYASMRDIVRIMQQGDVLLHAVTIPEGLTTAQVIALLETFDILAGDIGAENVVSLNEGSLLPETYHVPRGTKRRALLAQMQNAQAALVAELWQKRQANLPLKTPQEAIILASIVEKETGMPHERGTVAAVFINRLRRNMRLQSDPTIIYGLVGGQGRLGRPIRQSEIDRKTPYNTYQIKGLPPTPIANPGRAALQAVLNPPVHSALYFVSDGAGGHIFADTLEAHNRNVRQYRQRQQ